MLDVSTLKYVLNEADTQQNKDISIPSQKAIDTTKLALSSLHIDADMLKLENMKPLNFTNTKNLDEVCYTIDNYLKTIDKKEFTKVKSMYGADLTQPFKMVLASVPTDYDAVVLLDKIGILRPLMRVFRVLPNRFDPVHKDPRNLIDIPPYRAKYINTVVIPGLIVIVIKMIIGNFVNIGLNKLAVIKIEKNLQNEKLYDFIMNDINSIYKAHPEYSPVNTEQFKRTSLWKRYTAGWRDLDRYKFLYNITYDTFDAIYTTACLLFLPFKGFLLSIPARMALGFLGIRIGGTYLAGRVMEIEGNTVCLRISLTSLGFIITEPELYVKNTETGSLVRLQLKEPPKYLYQMSKDEMIKAFQSMKNPKEELITLKKRVEYLNDKVE